MNKRRFLLPLFVFAGVMGGVAYAQPAGVPHPPPLVLAPQGNMKWQITVQTDQTPGVPSVPPSANDPTELDYEHIGEWTHLEIHFVASSSVAWWISHGYVFNRSNSTSPITVSATDRFLPFPYDSADFYGVGRVKPADDQGEADFQGKRCQYYRYPALSSSASGGSAAPPVYEAWFDLKTGLPVGYRAGNKTYLFTFLTPARDDFEVPSDYKDMLKMRLETPQ